MQDYFQYEFYKLKNNERRKYMTFSKLLETIKICNNKSKRIYFDDKALFNETFGRYINREWLDVQNSKFYDFKNFAKKIRCFFKIKDRNVW